MDQPFLYCACKLTEIPSELHDRLLFTELSSALCLESEAVLVVERRMLGELGRAGAGYRAGEIPLEALQNVNPYAPPRPVIAAGGIIRHRTTDELLCIRRHGVLDLPKGKLDPNESIAACAVRELKEETGAEDLVQGTLLGISVHGYRRREFYEVKNTYWYAFTSESMKFTPAVEEGIDAVLWIPYQEAEQTLGYEPLRDLLADLRSVTDQKDEPARDRRER